MSVAYSILHGSSVYLVEAVSDFTEACIALSDEIKTVTSICQDVGMVFHASSVVSFLYTLFGYAHEMGYIFYLSRPH